jgi:hypothetical protein
VKLITGAKLYDLTEKAETYDDLFVQNYLHYAK